jgi:hypothetical protein
MSSSHLDEHPVQVLAINQHERNQPGMAGKSQDTIGFLDNQSSISMDVRYTDIKLNGEKKDKFFVIDRLIEPSKVWIQCFKSPVSVSKLADDLGWKVNEKVHDLCGPDHNLGTRLAVSVYEHDMYGARFVGSCMVLFADLVKYRDTSLTLLDPDDPINSYRSIDFVNVAIRS